MLSPEYFHCRVVPAVYADEKFAVGWRIVEVSISSSGLGWGTGTIQRDAEELAKCVHYFKAKRPNGKIVMMGHSTGCQDAFYLMTRYIPHPPLDGIILQAPVSDREAFHSLAPTSTLLTIATTLINTPASPDHPYAPRGNTILPIELTSQVFGPHVPITANRWYSLTASPDPITRAPRGDEDFFSADFPESVVYRYTFGMLKPDSVKVLVLFSEEDEWVSSEIDKEKLVGTWIKVMKEKGVRVDEVRSGVVEEATHDLARVEDSIMADVVGRIKGFLRWVEQA